MTSLYRFTNWMAQRKDHKKWIIGLIILDIIMAVASNIVDWPWLMSVPWYVRPFAPICSLFPLTLAIWFLIYKQKKRVAPWFTWFILVGIISYGIMAQIYYPVYILNWAGWHWRLAGNMLWVAIYASQSLIIISEIKSLPYYQYALIMAYYLFKDYSDRYLGSFIDTLVPGFPIWLKDLFFGIIVSLHIIVFIGLLYHVQRKNVPKSFQKKIAATP